jgi:hypothetical protein
MASLAISLSFKRQWVSQPDINIVMTCMDCHETSLPLHRMIPITFILPHPVFSITPILSSNFRPCLLHQPRAIPQSTISTPSAHPSHK